jgi:hypothetical protein
VRVTPPDVELWLIEHVRAVAADEGKNVDVMAVEPDRLELELARPLIVIRDDSGSRLDHTTFDRSVGASVLGGSKNDPEDVITLSRWLAGVLFDLDLPLTDGCPIAAVVPDGCNGPYAVAESLDVARRYLTAQYVVTGSW